MFLEKQLEKNLLEVELFWDECLAKQKILKFHKAKHLLPL
jgi:hypothetical protein